MIKEINIDELKALFHQYEKKLMDDIKKT